MAIVSHEAMRTVYPQGSNLVQVCVSGGLPAFRNEKGFIFFGQFHTKMAIVNHEAMRTVCPAAALLCTFFGLLSIYMVQC